MSSKGVFNDDVFDDVFDRVGGDFPWWMDGDEMVTVAPRPTPKSSPVSSSIGSCVGLRRRRVNERRVTANDIADRMMPWSRMP